MITPTLRVRHLQRGVVLVSSLLLLLVVTIMALSMFRSFGIQEKVAGMAQKPLVQQGGELAYLLLHDPEFRRVGQCLRELGREFGALGS